MTKIDGVTIKMLIPPRLFVPVFYLVGIGFAFHPVAIVFIPKENTKSEPVSHWEEPVRILCVWYGRRDSNPRPVPRFARDASGGFNVLRTWRSWVFDAATTPKSGHPARGCPDFGTADGIRTHDLQSRSYQAGLRKSLIWCAFRVFCLFPGVFSR